MRKILVFGLLFLGILVNIAAQDKIAAPTLVSPADSSNIDVEVILDWSSVSGAVSYKLEIDTSNNFSSPLKQTIETTYSAHTVKDLLYGTTYYWRVSAKNVNNLYSSPSEVWNFTTKASVTLTIPADNSKKLPVKFTFRWNAIKGSKYLFQLDTTSDFNSLLKKEYSELNIDTIDLFQLNYGQNYYWRVKAYHDYDSSEWSDVRFFTTKGDVIAKYPTDNFEGFIPGDSIIFHTIFGSQYGELIISEDSSFDVQFYYIFDSTKIARIKVSNNPPKYDTLTKVATGDLKFNQDCYWKARLFHAKDTSDWSDVYHFKTIDTLGLLLPSNGAQDINPSSDSLSWSSIYAADEYIIYYDTLSNLSTSKTVSINSQDTLYNRKDKFVYYLRNLNLKYNKTYYWAIKAKHVRDELMSDTWSFETIDNTSINNYQSSNFTILPNPASDYVKVNFNSEQTGAIVIKNILGQEVYREKINKAVYTTIPISSLDNGIYIIEFNGIDVYFAKKLVVKH
ncbi:MAG: T9SS type A sorting domain-containing protein [Bacteroidales bacterium]|jgi:hypothetical protein|nr:T9SS type A sorting domain-containing protein [Bacteroidales bacterium]MDI9575170.1 T9SS type A sorting domain-containing protein [Bacteroidota bacterium]MDD2593098.1 T9SS type A sorting domain-containing protein [Bacteroidales bacterium]MDD3755714.1 T9SS type A sorting domain-containing protein [Bacteroidales bacterium]MDY0400835.1 T9SS type A sorting domain-containing protein [Bacteroidales bacterium]